MGGIEARPTIETVTTNATLNGHGDQNYRQSRKNRSDSIICMTCNAQSLIPKKDELILNTQLYKPLIIGVTETWANGEKEDGCLKLDGYVMYRSDRIGRRGGGDYTLCGIQIRTKRMCSNEEIHKRDPL